MRMKAMDEQDASAKTSLPDFVSSVPVGASEHEMKTNRQMRTREITEILKLRSFSLLAQISTQYKEIDFYFGRNFFSDQPIYF